VDYFGALSAREVNGIAEHGAQLTHLRTDCKAKGADGGAVVIKEGVSLHLGNASSVVHGGKLHDRLVTNGLIAALRTDPSIGWRKMLSTWASSCKCFSFSISCNVMAIRAPE
jgi:hypothetical protein